MVPAHLRSVLSSSMSGGADQLFDWTSDSRDDLLVVDEVPHAWLFPRTAAIVHHGGAGTTGTALEAGIPSIVVPSFADQFFWAERTAHLAVGLDLPRRRFTVDELTYLLGD